MDGNAILKMRWDRGGRGKVVNVIKKKGKIERKVKWKWDARESEWMLIIFLEGMDWDIKKNPCFIHINKLNNLKKTKIINKVKYHLSGWKCLTFSR